MLHLVPTPAPEPTPRQYAEAVSRLASVKHALRLVDGFGGGPASDADEARDCRRLGRNRGGEAPLRFDRKSAELVGVTAAGVEALLDERQKGREPNAEASRALVEQIRRELADVARVILRLSRANRLRRRRVGAPFAPASVVKLAAVAARAGARRRSGYWP